jgi:hypothetical protein
LSDTFEIAGMAYGNAESRILSYANTEVLEGGSTFLERVYRIMEFGMCHTIFDLKDIFSELGTNCFE